MKLEQAIEIAKGCGLTTMGEAIFNIKLHAISTFAYDEIKDELEELQKDFLASGMSIDTLI